MYKCKYVCAYIAADIKVCNRYLYARLPARFQCVRIFITQLPICLANLHKNNFVKICLQYTYVQTYILPYIHTYKWVPTLPE